MSIGKLLIGILLLILLIDNRTINCIIYPIKPLPVKVLYEIKEANEKGISIIAADIAKNLGVSGAEICGILVHFQKIGFIEKRHGCYYTLI